MRGAGGPRHDGDASVDPPSFTTDDRLLDELPYGLAPDQQATVSIPPPEASPSVIGAQPRLIPERSRSIRASVYRQGARVSYDPALQAISFEFILWPLHSAEDLALAFGTLLPRVEAILARRDHTPLALLIDLAGFEVADLHRADAEQMLRELIAEICEDCAPGRPLAIRYDSRRTPTSRRRAANVKRIEKIDPLHPEALIPLLDTLLASRDEAAALLRRLRSLPSLLPSS